VHEEAAVDPQRPDAGSRCLEVSSCPNPLTFKTVAVLSQPTKGPLHYPTTIPPYRQNLRRSLPLDSPGYWEWSSWHRGSDLPEAQTNDRSVRHV
jgi:hypothetical protein